MDRGVRVVAGVAAVLLMFGVAPGARADVQRPVHGLHDAYHGVLALPPAPRAVRRLYFSGQPIDEVSKLGGVPTATFSSSKPTGAFPITQNTSPASDVTDTSAWNDPFTAYWTGPFSGRINGNVDLAWFWSSVNPDQQVLAAVVVVKVWADPAGTAKPIGQARFPIQVGPATPRSNVDFVRVDGTVRRTLSIGVAIEHGNDAEDLRVSYGSADTPSSMTIPAERSAPAPRVLRNKRARYSGRRLELQSAGIGSQSGEPTIGIERNGTAFVDGGNLTIDNEVAEGGFTPDVRRSRDDGRHWVSVQPRLPDGTAEPPTSLDPYLYVDPDTGRVFYVNIYVGCAHLAYSDDEGATWSQSPLACGHPANDHPTLVAGRPPAGVQTTGYRNVVYYCLSQAVQGVCGRSLDGGLTWLPLPAATFPYGTCGGLHGHVIADPAGRLFIPGGRCTYPWITMSSDGGMSWRQVQVSTLPGYSTQTSVASDRDGNLFYVWYGLYDRLPYLAYSTDHGLTWSAPRMIAPPSVRQVNLPTIDAGSRGRIAVSFAGTTQLPPAPRPVDPSDLIGQLFGPTNNDFRAWNMYVVESTNALSGDPMFVSATGNDPKDPINRGPCGDLATGRCGLMFDFLDISIDSSGRAWATEVDTCTHNQGRSGIDCVARTKATADGNTGSTSNVGVVVKQIGGPSLVAGRR